MPHEDRLFLLTGRSTSRHQTVYAGISLTDEKNALKSGEIWNAWLATTPLTPVTLTTHRVVTTHLSTSEGSKWDFDGIITKASEGKRDPSRPRLNEVTRLKCIPPKELALPVFVAAHSGLKP